MTAAAVISSPRPGDLHFSVSEKRDFADIATRRLASGDAVYYEGDDPTHCYQVVSGALKEYATLEDGRRQISEFYHTGDLFGATEQGVCAHSVEAITPTVIRCYPREVFFRKAAHDPRFAEKLVETLIDRLNRAQERLTALGRMNAAQRVASFLMRLHGDGEPETITKIEVSRHDLADYLGLSAETVCRCITDMKKKQVIDMQTARELKVPDPDRLNAVIEGRLRIC